MPIIAHKRHGALVDLYHHGHIAVVDVNGVILRKFGDPRRVTYSRSSAKPMQAIAALECGVDITPEELAVICASHGGEEIHVAAVRRILAKAGLDESALQCGVHKPFSPAANADNPLPVQNNCSGKHAGMLYAAKIMGESLHDYCLPSHPHQQRILRAIAEICDYPAEEIIIGCDGCGVPVHAMPLFKFAQGYARMARENSAIVRAMRAHPEMVDRPGGFTTELMRAFGDRLFCKVGADAFFAVGLLEHGIGIAIKIDDGCTHVIPPVVLETLVQLGVITQAEALALPQFRQLAHINHKGETIGETAPVFTLENG